MGKDASGRRRDRTVRALALGAATLAFVSIGSGSPGARSARAAGGPAAPYALTVDPAGSGFLANGVFEPGETVIVAPSWISESNQPFSLTGVAVGFSGPPVATYSVVDNQANYGTIPPFLATSCLATGDCYALSVVKNAMVRPEHWDTTFTERTTAGMGQRNTHTWTLHLGDSFSDVPRSNKAYRAVETLFHRGIMGGCAPGLFCPDVDVTREQFALYVLTAHEPPGYAPKACSPSDPRTFVDVPDTSPYCPWVEELDRRMGGLSCGIQEGYFCPDQSPLREEAMLIAVTIRSGPLAPPLAGCVPGLEMFEDVPAESIYCPAIEEMARLMQEWGDGEEGDPTCTPSQFCPADIVPRKDLTRFLAASYNMRLYQ